MPERTFRRETASKVSPKTLGSAIIILPDLIINWNCCTCENIILEGVGAAKKRDGPVND
jgi:hypothetical protein